MPGSVNQAKFDTLEVDRKREILDEFVEKESLKDALEECFGNGPNISQREVAEKVISAWEDHLGETDLDG